MYRSLFLAALLAATLGAARSAHAEDRVTWNPLTKETLGSGDLRYFDMQYDGSWANEALVALGQPAPGKAASRGAFAEAVLKTLQAKLPATSRQAALAAPPVPGWLLSGYQVFQPTTVSKSRWMNDLAALERGTAPANPLVKPNADLAALYAYWCMYDAEWFNASRKAAYKAWLTAIQLSYPAQWQTLNHEPQIQLHTRLVKPLQTRDETYREIDNWITALKKNEGGFAKPLVRRSLVEELLARGGYSADGQAATADSRLYEDTAYAGAAPAGLGLSDQQFFLLAALAVEFSGELNMLDPGCPQLKPFADYFIAAFEREK